MDTAGHRLPALSRAPAPGWPPQALNVHSGQPPLQRHHSPVPQPHLHLITLPDCTSAQSSSSPHPLFHLGRPSLLHQGNCSPHPASAPLSLGSLLMQPTCSPSSPHHPELEMSTSCHSPSPPPLRGLSAGPSTVHRAPARCQAQVRSWECTVESKMGTVTSSRTPSRMQEAKGTLTNLHRQTKKKKQGDNE